MIPREVVSQMWQIDSGKPGPTVTILGGVHGNETSGIAIVKNLLARDASFVEYGVLNLGIGNPAAVALGERFVPGDFDLNRAFKDLPPERALTIAAQRANELKPILAATHILIDLHATLKPSEPMVLVPNMHDELMQKIVPLFGIGKVLIEEGVMTEESTLGGTTNAFVMRAGGTALTIESGWCEDVSIVPRLEQSVLYVLVAVGIAPSLQVGAIAPIALEMYESYWSVPASDNFTFTATWPNFALVPKGTHFATDGNTKLVIPEDSYMIFQKAPQYLKSGLDACLLLRRV